MRPALCIPVFLVLLVFTPALADTKSGEKIYPWKTHIELSFTSTNGNSDTQTISGKFGIKKEGPVNRYYLSGSLLRSESQGVETSNRLAFDGRLERPVTKRFYLLYSAGYLRDRFSGYDLRLYTGPGLGAEIIKWEKQHLQTVINILYYHDEFTSGEKGTDDYINPKASARYEWRIRENVKFTEEADFSISLKEPKRYFIDSTTSFSVKIGGPLSLGVSYTVNYQHAPPSPDIKHTDTTFLTSLVIDI